MFDPNYGLKVGGHEQSFGPSGELLMLTALPSASPASLAAMKTIAASTRQDGAVYTLQDSGQQWRYSAGSTLTGDNLLVATPTDTLGRFIRVDTDVDITASITFATADDAVLFTVPAGFQLFVPSAYYHVITSWTGGSSSAIGISSSNTGLNTDGDLLGGASGDVAAGLLSTGAYAKGTIGTKAGKPGALLVGSDTIIYTRMTSVFTAGAATLHVPVRVLLAPAS